MTTDGATPILITAQNNHVEVVKVLASAGASLDQAMTTDGCTPILIATEKNHVEVVKVLADRKSVV